MRNLSTQPRPSTETGKSQTLKTRALVKGYPELLRFDLNPIDDNTFEIVPASLGSANKFTRFTFELGTEALQWSITDDWTIDFTETTIDTSTFVGGIVDGIGRKDVDYLYWAFLDADFVFAGIGATQKPISTYTAVAAALGANVNFTVATTYGNAFKFTIGARVLIKNNTGTFTHTKEYNWGTIISIVSSTVLNITMDSDTEYGRAITNAAGGTIEQWDKFRPWVPAGSSQALYKPYYALLGEVEQASTLIINVYKKTDEFRDFFAFAFDDAVNAYTLQFIELGYWIPLWTNSCNIRLSIQDNSTNLFILVQAPSTAIVHVRSNSNQQIIENNSGLLKLFRKARYNFQVTGTNLDARFIIIEGYFIEGGMRE